MKIVLCIVLMLASLVGCTSDDTRVMHPSEIEAFVLAADKPSEVTVDDLKAFMDAADAVGIASDEIPACYSVGCPVSASGTPDVWSPCPPYVFGGVMGELCWCPTGRGNARLCTL